MLNEADAYKKTDEVFREQFEEFYDWLDESRINYRLQQEQLERRERAQSSIMSEILERKLNVRDIFEHPLQSNRDSIQRRKANLQRLHSDPGIAAVKDLYTPSQLPIIEALEALLHSKNNQDSEKYNLIVKNYILRVSSNAESVFAGFEGDKELANELKEALPDITLKLTYTTFGDLSGKEKSTVIRIVQLARQLKVVEDVIPVKKVTTANISVKSADTLERERLKDLREDLEKSQFKAPDDSRSIKDPHWPVFREEEWWRQSVHRQWFLANMDRVRRKYEYSVKKYGSQTPRKWID